MSNKFKLQTFLIDLSDETSVYRELIYLIYLMRVHSPGEMAVCLVCEEKNRF